ncbi:MAG: glutathione S-transferase family protein, partial [Candidatus Binatia bacterium]
GEGEDENLRVGTVGFKGAPLRKTRAFLAANPFGTVPAAFSPDGKTGIFESNSIMRAVARLGERRFPNYGRDPYEAARIDAFLDASLVFARDAQHYLLGLMGGDVAPDVHARARDAFAVYLGGIDQGLAPDRAFLVGDDVTLADVCFVAELCLFSNEKARGEALAKRGLEPILDAGLADTFPRALRHFAKLRAHPAFAPDVEPYLAKLEGATR